MEGDREICTFMRNSSVSVRSNWIIRVCWGWLEKADVTACPLLVGGFQFSTTLRRPSTHTPPTPNSWQPEHHQKSSIAAAAPVYSLWIYALLSFFRCLHNLRGDLFLDSECVWLCGGGRRELPSQPVRPAGTDGGTRNHQIEHRWAAEVDRAGHLTLSFFTSYRKKISIPFLRTIFRFFCLPDGKPIFNVSVLPFRHTLVPIIAVVFFGEKIKRI